MIGPNGTDENSAGRRLESPADPIVIDDTKLFCVDLADAILPGTYDTTTSNHVSLIFGTERQR